LNSGRTRSLTVYWQRGSFSPSPSSVCNFAKKTINEIIVRFHSLMHVNCFNITVALTGTTDAAMVLGDCSHAPDLSLAHPSRLLPSLTPSSSAAVGNSKRTRSRRRRSASVPDTATESHSLRRAHIRGVLLHWKRSPSLIPVPSYLISICVFARDCD
jgi:hypothetical protein